MRRTPAFFARKHPYITNAPLTLERNLTMNVNPGHVRAAQITQRTNKPHFFVYDQYIIEMRPA